MNNENQNQNQKPMTDYEASVVVADMMGKLLPNKGDGMEFKIPVVPAVLRKEGKGRITDMNCHCVYRGDDDKLVFRDMNYRSKMPLAFLNAKESVGFMETVKQESEESINRYKDGKAMRNAIVERVTTPTARSFTHDQADTIRRYLGSFDDPQERDARASYVWNEAKDAGDFGRYPEKWEKDALKEFNDIKNGLTNGQEENRHAHVRL